MQEPFNAEPPVSTLITSYLTHEDLFYTRNHGPIPILPDPSTYYIYLASILWVDSLKRTILCSFRFHRTLSIKQTSPMRFLCVPKTGMRLSTAMLSILKGCLNLTFLSAYMRAGTDSKLALHAGITWCWRDLFRILFLSPWNTYGNVLERAFLCGKICAGSRTWNYIGTFCHIKD